MQKSKIKNQSDNAKSKNNPVATGYRSFAFCILHFDLNNKGFTLLETVVALTVILAAIVGPVSLITRGLFDFSFAKDKLIAANLAQEGVEVVRLIRENNDACANLGGPPQWNKDPRGGFMTQLHVEIDATDFSDRVSCGGTTLQFPHMSQASPDCSQDQHLLYDPMNGTYGYSGSQQTIFSRCVDITVPPASPTTGIPAADQMDVVSTVAWNEHGNPRTMILQERLYNWK